MPRQLSPAGGPLTRGGPGSASRRSPAAPSRASRFKTVTGPTVGDVGELKLLSSLRRYFDGPSTRLVIPAPEDDAAVWRGDPFVVGTTDTMVENVDFRLDWPGFDFGLLGRRLVSINLSDLAAMGAEPRHALISLILPQRTRVADVERLYRGIHQQAHRYGCAIAGGDLSGTEGPLVLTATVIGRARSARQLLRRRGGRPGWLIAVTGALGAAAAGLRLLERGAQAKSAMERSWLKAQLDPVPQLAAGRLLTAAGVRVGGDVSDGLLREVERITELDGLGASICVRDLPLAKGLEPDEWPLAARDSEDFQLVCAAPRSTISAARRVLTRHRLRLTTVGVVEDEPGLRLRDRDRMVTLEGAGYQHFR